MEKRNLKIISIIIIVIGIIIVSYGGYLVWQSRTIPEGGLLTAPAIIAIFFGCALLILGLRWLARARRQT